MIRIKVDDVELAVKSVGTGPVLLLVHGFPFDHSIWDGQLDDLSRDFQVIAPDLRGFGTSQVTGDVVTMERFALDLIQLLDHLAITKPVTFCGLSMGGYIAWAMLRQQPNRIGRLVLCDTRAASDTPVAAQNRLDLANRVLQEGAGVAAATMIPRLFAPATMTGRPELVSKVDSLIRRTSPLGIAAALRGMAVRPDSTSALSEISVPTLLTCGEHDPITTPLEMKGMAAIIPIARYVPISGAGHLAPLENPMDVNRAIRDAMAWPTSGS